MWMSSLRVIKDLPWFLFPEESPVQACSGTETVMSTASQSPGGTLLPPHSTPRHGQFLEKKGNAVLIPSGERDEGSLA